MNDMDTDLSDCREKALKVLQKWWERNGNGATVGILINALKRLDRKDVVVKLRSMKSPLVKEIFQYQVYLDLFTFMTKKLNTYVEKIFERNLRGLVKEASF